MRRLRFLTALPVCVLAALAEPALAQEIRTYTESTGPLALGYPVPIPVDSLRPVNGFRSYDALQMRYLELALDEERVARFRVGQSVEGRPIWAFRLGDPDTTTTDGLAEPGMLFNGTIHAREWQSPEIITEIFERLALNSRDGGLFQYLSENVEVTIVPQLNPDGFLQTQRFPDAVVGGDPRSPRAVRDGRQRRKNLTDADDDLRTFADAALGVDLNRNFPPFFGNASGDPRSDSYFGLRALSEPESQALVSAGGLIPEGRLRLFVDFHSFSKLIYAPLTLNERRNALTLELSQKVARTLAGLGSTYAIEPLPREDGLGATDEFHAETFQIPSLTFEAEPNGRGGLEYGGLGAPGDGFMLPDAEIARVRDEVAQSFVMALYHQAGPPALVAARVVDAVSGDLVYASEWQAQADGSRRRVVAVDEPLEPGRAYRLWAAFNKPMRVRRDGAVVPYAGMDQPDAPLVTVRDGETPLDVRGIRWIDQPGEAPDGYRRYRDDAFSLEFTTLPASESTGQGVRLGVEVSDFALQGLDADPSTPVDWANGGWSGYEDDRATLILGGRARTSR